MRISQVSIAALFLALSCALAAADEAQIVGKEPPTGALHLGQTVLVDDGTCPTGQVKEITSGHGGKQGAGPTRQRRCVPDPRTNQ
jgi:hypothetical protein